MAIDADGRVLVGDHGQVDGRGLFALDLVSDLVGLDQGMQVQGLSAQIGLVLEEGVLFFDAGPCNLWHVVKFPKEDLVVELIVVVLVAQELEGSRLGAVGAGLWHVFNRFRDQDVPVGSQGTEGEDHHKAGETAD